MKTIKTKKHTEIMSIDNYFVIDNALILNKDYFKLDNQILDSLLRDKNLARYDSIFGNITDIEKPCNWDSILPATPYSDNIPMFITNLLVNINKNTYQILRNETTDYIEIQAINQFWLNNYFINNNIYFSKSNMQYTIWSDDVLVALIMPAYIKNSYIVQLVDEINLNRHNLKIGA